MPTEPKSSCCHPPPVPFFFEKTMVAWGSSSLRFGFPIKVPSLVKYLKPRVQAALNLSEPLSDVYFGKQLYSSERHLFANKVNDLLAEKVEEAFGVHKEEFEREFFSCEELDGESLFSMTTFYWTPKPEDTSKDTSKKGWWDHEPAEDVMISFGHKDFPPLLEFSASSIREGEYHARHVKSFCGSRLAEKEEKYSDSASSLRNAYIAKGLEVGEVGWHLFEYTT